MKKLICSTDKKCEIVDVNVENRTVSFYPVVWNSTDSWGRQYGPKSFNRTIKNNETFPFLLEHNAELVVGKTVDAVADDRGLKVTAQIIDTTAGSDFLAVADAGLYKFSFAGYILQSEDKVVNSQSLEYVTELKLLEVTATLFPANEKASLISLNKQPMRTTTETPTPTDGGPVEVSDEMQRLIDYIKEY